MAPPDTRKEKEVKTTQSITSDDEDRSKTFSLKFRYFHLLFTFSLPHFQRDPNKPWGKTRFPAIPFAMNHAYT